MSAEGAAPPANTPGAAPGATGAARQPPLTALMPLKNGVLLLDKSALQGLSLAETKVLYPRAMLYQNIPPILLHEIRGDLAKVHAKGRDVATVVTGLASKVNGVGAAINVDHREICTANLLGQGVDMDSTAIMPFGASGGGLDAAGRRTGVVIDQLPLERTADDSDE